MFNIYFFVSFRKGIFLFMKIFCLNNKVKGKNSSKNFTLYFFKFKTFYLSLNSMKWSSPTLKVN